VAVSEHFLSLRRILLRSFIVFLVLYLLLLHMFPRFFSYIVDLSGAQNHDVVFFGISDVLGFYFTAPALVAALLTLPVFLLLFYSWARDALFPEERKKIANLATISAVLFLVGVLISIPLFPRILELSYFFSGALGAKLLLSAPELFNLWLSLAVLLGLVFEFPVLLYFLVRSGIVSPELLKKYRSYAYLLFYVLAAVITPGDLLVTDVLLFTIFVLLYEGSLLLAAR